MAINPQDNIDPNIDNSTKQALNNSGGWYDNLITNAANSLRRAQPNGAVYGGPARSGTAEGRISQAMPDDNGALAGILTATGTSTQSPPNVNDPNNASSAALTAGLRRSTVPGVYTARMKDGSIGFTDQANGFDNYGSGVDANGNVPSNLVAQGPNVGNAYAANSLQTKGFDTSAQGLDASSPQDIQAQLNALNGQNTNGNPELATANAALKARLVARQQNFQQGDYPGGPASQSGVGGGYGLGPGAAGGLMGLTGKDLLDYNQKQQEITQQGVLGQERIQDQHNAQQQQDLKDLESHVGELNDPDQRSSFLFSRIPSNPRDMADWAQSREGQYVIGQLNNQLSDVGGGALFGGSGGSTKGVGIDQLKFDRGNNDFTIGRPNSMFPDYNARALGSINRLPQSWYNTQNVSSLRRLQQFLAQQNQQNDGQ